MVDFPVNDSDAAARFVVLTLKTGRRSTWAGRTDALCPAGQLDGNSSVTSFDEALGFDPDSGDEIRLGDLLVGQSDDPSMTASRNLDWAEFLEAHDGRYGELLRQIAEGKTVKDIADERQTKYCRIRKIKDDLREDLLQFMGQSVITDALHPPAWRGNIIAEHERSACKAARRSL